MKALTFLFLVLLLLPRAAVAGPFEDSQLAFGHEDWPTALKLIQPLADQGNAVAQYELGLMYMAGWAVKPDPAAAAGWYQKSAAQGNVDAQLVLGKFYEQGRGVPQDYAQAQIWYHKAADQGDPAAEMLLGLMYRDGRGVKQDGAQAVAWLEKASHMRDAMAGPMSQRYLATMYATGQGGVKQDYAQALSWYRKLSDAGDTMAEIEIGMMYEFGNDAVKQDHDEADKFYRLGAPGLLQAAVQGNSWARFRMDALFGPGQGERAGKWFERAAPGILKAANSGNLWAQTEMGLLYERGWGVKRDDAEAYFWRSVAAKTTAPGFTLPDAQATLTADQKAAIQKRVADWKPAVGTP